MMTREQIKAGIRCRPNIAACAECCSPSRRPAAVARVRASWITRKGAISAKRRPLDAFRLLP
jgi:hypothetical protein